MKKYRDNGAIGALLDEYEKAINELKKVINDISKEELIAIADNDTKDPDCKSIQTVLTHVVKSGYGYAIAIRKYLKENIDYLERRTLGSVIEYQNELSNMFAYNEKLFEDYPNLKIEELENEKKIKVRWGQQYDIEQLMEHAIVHILRHRRQIERFILKLRKKGFS